MYFREEAVFSRTRTQVTPPSMAAQSVSGSDAAE